MRVRRFVVGAVLVALVLPSAAFAGWRTEPQGLLTLARACRDGALVSATTLSDGGDDVNVTVGARRYDNRNVPLAGNEIFFGPPVNPITAYGPEIVGAPSLRAINVTTQPDPLESDADRGSGVPSLLRKHGTVLLPWNAPLTPGTQILVSYQREDGELFAAADGPVADCLLRPGPVASDVSASLPPTPADIPPALLRYQLTGWPNNGLLQFGSQPLVVGARIPATALTANPLTYSSLIAPFADRATFTVAGTNRVSANGATAGNNTSNDAVVSADGRVIAFATNATNLVAGDANSARDVLLRDRSTGALTLVSRTAAGTPGNATSGAPALSADGRYTTFVSAATNLVSGDTNANDDIFRFDRTTNTVIKVSLGAGNVQANSASREPVISADGNLIAFTSTANNLVGGDANNQQDIFVRDVAAGVTRCLTCSNGAQLIGNGSDQPAISADGQTVAFRSSDHNVANENLSGRAQIFVIPTTGGQAVRISRTSNGSVPNGSSREPAVSADGQTVAFSSMASDLISGDGNTSTDVFVFVRSVQQTQRVSLAADGSELGTVSNAPALSADGRYVLFNTSAAVLPYDENGIVDVYRYDRTSTAVRLVSERVAGGAANNLALNPEVSADGSVTTFDSAATDLLPGTASTTHVYFWTETPAELRIGLSYRALLPLVTR